MDLDGDGADDLLLGWHDTDSYDMQDGYAFAVYRLADDVPTFCFEGWERNRYQICSDHSVYLSGSAGASYTTYEKLLFRIMYNKGPVDGAFLGPSLDATPFSEYAELTEIASA